MPDEVLQDQAQDQTQGQAAADGDKGKQPDVVTRAEFDQLIAQNKTLAGALLDAGKKLEVVDKVADMLRGKSADTLTEQEQSVVKELHRIMPNLKALDSLPTIEKAVQQASAVASETLVQAAFGYQLELQEAAGIRIDDPKTNRVVAGALRDYMNEDKTRGERFWRGDRTIIKEAFDDVKSSVLDPLRTGEKKAVGDIVKHRPKNAAPVGSAGAGGGGEPGKINFQDPKAVREAFKAALSAT